MRPRQPFFFNDDGDLSHWIGQATQIEHPDVETQSLAEVTDVPSPLTVSNQKYGEIWELELEDAVKYALENAKVMRTLGGRRTNFGVRPQQDESPDSLQRGPASIPTVYDPAIVEADPFFGVEGALANFDAQLQSSLTYAKTDRPQNFTAVGGSIFNLIRTQDLATWNSTLQKRMVTGGRVGLTAQTIGDYNNSPIRQVPGDVFQSFEVFGSQPLLQGGGIFYNRIAGPNDPFSGFGTPQFDGVVLARIRTDISLADFEAGVRNLVNEVENSYWDLYFAYRNLEALKVGRDSALATWQKVYSLYTSNTRGGEADKEAQAREQYFFFRSQVETALSDLYRAESRLRFTMGLAASDSRLIAPVTEPTTAKVVFEWNEIHAESLMRSVELRQQKWRIKQRELELMASKNLLLPRLDATGRYRVLGLGDNWWDKNGNAFNGQVGDQLAGTNAMAGVTDGNFTESEVGLQFSMDLGFRRALTTVRQQQLFLARERSVLQDQELELSHQLTEAVRLLDTNYTLVQTIFNRRLAAERQVKSVEAAYNNGTVTFDLLLDAQRRQADAESITSVLCPITTAASPRFTTVRVRCWNTTTCSWPKARGRVRRTSTPSVMLGNATPGFIWTMGTPVPTC
ncbi:MAG: TolC family protein [Pirellulales bacterium]